MVESQLFDTFCRLLDKIEKANGITAKKQILDDYLQDWKRKYGPNCYQPLRLLMPKYTDKNYGLKDLGLTKVILSAMSLSQTSPDGIYLKNYKAPHANRPSGAFHLAVYEVIKSRSTVKTSTQTMQDISDLLDSLLDKNIQGPGEDSASKKQTKLIKQMIESYTPHQIQWIIRFILKDLKLGMSEQSILGVLHANANELHDSGRSLMDICKSVANPQSQDSIFRNLELFSPCIPQSGSRFQEKLLDGHFASFDKPFYCEPKLDGERMIMHFDPIADKFMWFSRKKNDYTGRYGNSSKSTNKLSNQICDGLPRRSVILDGEMVAYSPELGGFLPFGTLKSTSVDSKGREAIEMRSTINDPTKPHPCYIVFDILYYNGAPMIDRPLRDRLALLNECVRNQNKHMILINREEMNTIEEVHKALDKAVENQQEGIVIKNPAAKYKLNSRDASWIKFKPDYMDALAENCDLLLVGSKYGSGKYGGRYRQLLCAVRDDSIPISDPPKFTTFAMVHSGMNDEEVNRLQSMIKKNVPYTPDRPPSWIDHPPKSNEVPDTLIHFEDAIVVEVKGTEIIPSAQFGLQHTLRFPRFVRFRPDKGWQDIMTASEFVSAKQEGRRGQKRANDDSSTSSKKKVARKNYTILASQQGASTKGEFAESSLFQDMKFYVLNGNQDYSKQDIELLIFKNGGSFVQDNGPGVMNIGGDEDIKSITHRLRVIHDNKSANVIRAKYLLDCIKMEDVLKLEPKYMYVTLDSKRNEFLEYMDEYGDYYDKYTNGDNLREVIESMGKDESQTEKERRKVVQEISRKYFSHQMEGLLFLDVVAYFDHNTSFSMTPPRKLSLEWVRWKRNQEEMKIAQDRFEFEAGKVKSTKSEEVTHVIVSNSDLGRVKSLIKDFHRSKLPRFVTLEWIQACIDGHTLVDESRYQPPIPIQL